MPRKRAVLDRLTEELHGNEDDDLIEELFENEESVGHQAKGGFPFKGKGSRDKAMAQLRKMQKDKKGK